MIYTNTNLERIYRDKDEREVRIDRKRDKGRPKDERRKLRTRKLKEQEIED